LSGPIILNRLNYTPTTEIRTKSTQSPKRQS